MTIKNKAMKTKDTIKMTKRDAMDLIYYAIKGLALTDARDGKAADMISKIFQEIAENTDFERVKSWIAGSLPTKVFKPRLDYKKEIVPGLQPSDITVIQIAQAFSSTFPTRQGFMPRDIQMEKIEVITKN